MDLPKFANHNGTEVRLVYSVVRADVVKAHYESKCGQFFWTHYQDATNEFTKTNIA